MYLEILTPDESVFEGEVVYVTLPGSEGSFQILNNHASLISILTKGGVRFKQEKGKEKVLDIEGGVVEVLNNKAVLLAEKIIK